MFSQAKRYIREVGRSERDKVGGERKKDGEYDGGKGKRTGNREINYRKLKGYGKK